jgi:dTDP-4-amino-4,6-dideoxygalactose transaminase
LSALQRISVTKTFLPPLEDYLFYLKQIWETNQLTNNGPLVNELETRLKEYLNVKHLFFVSNGTIALQIAIKALELKGEIITTPFSYVATTSSIVWEGCQPVFVDIDPHTLCIDPNLIETAITENTTGILVTHVYGIPCAVEQIEAIAQRYHLKVIYDAAHTFGGNYKGKSIVSYGDISTLSFHATKVFHTVEGGALVTNDDGLAHRISYLRNFGHKGQEAFWGLGINGKNSELHAAMGLCNLPYVPGIIKKREKISSWYDDQQSELGIKRPIVPNGTDYNFAYYPAQFSSEEELVQIQAKLNASQIYPRRYFYPPLNGLPYVVKKPCPITQSISPRILCLPLYPELERDQILMISEIIRSNQS